MERTDRVKTSSQKDVCIACGAAIAPGSPMGQCSRCLARLAFLPRKESRNRRTAFHLPTIDELNAAFADLAVTRLVGSGGMGLVYYATTKSAGEPVALKILPGEHADDQSLVQRFEREAEALRRLIHPNIVRVLDAGSKGEFPYILLEYVGCDNLRDVMETRKLEPEEVCRFLGQLCDALEYAHRNGVVHRDIKPENILVDDDGTVRMVDFGLAKVMSGHDEDYLHLTGTGEAMGSLAYMAPESWSGAELDHRADIYSLGVVAYEMFTGRLPTIDLVPPSQIAPVDRGMDAVIRKMLRSDPKQRQSSAAEVKRDIESAVQRARRRPFVQTAGVALSLLLVVGLGALAFGLRPDPAQENASADRTATENKLELTKLRDIVSQSYVDLTNPSATFDYRGNEELGVATAIDGINFVGGWSVQGGADQDQSAVFQTVAPLDADEVAIDMRFSGLPGQKLHTFRISTTSDPNPTASDTSIHWQTTVPESASTSHEGTEATFARDTGIVSVAGSRGLPDAYTIVAKGPFQGVTGFRLEALKGDKASVGFEGGWQGDFHLSEFEVMSSPPPNRVSRGEKVALENATATYRGKYYVDSAIDGSLTGTVGWDMPADLRRNQSAVFPTAHPVSAAKIRFELEMNGGREGTAFQRFRLSYTRSPRPKINDAKSEWFELIPALVQVRPVGLKAMYDKSSSVISVQGTEKAGSSTYTVIVDTPVQDITGFRLDVLAGDNGTIAAKTENGDAVLSEFLVYLPDAASISELLSSSTSNEK